MKITSLASTIALGVVISGPLAAAPLQVDIGLAFRDAVDAGMPVITVKGGDDDRDDDRDERDDDRDDDRDDRNDDRDESHDDDDSDESDDDSWDDSDESDDDDSWDDSGNDGWDDSGNDGFDDSGSGRDEPRIPGGSGCDDPEDILEHPECAVPQRSRFSLGFND
jgi:hypothetical protein